MNLKNLLVVITVLWLGHAYAQTAMPGDTLTSRLQRYNRYYHAEKVHLHFDKPVYALGDTIWFSAYVVNTLHNIPADKSKLLHVELISPQNRVIKSLLLPLTTGFGAGDFTLADSLSGGSYHIRAYTNWMRNIDAAYFFDKKLQVIDPLPKQANAIVTINPAPATNIPKYDVQLFPEGGQLVAGLASAVAFKAVGADGLGVSVSGKLVDGMNAPVLDFRSQHAGMGAFSFTPINGANYAVLVKLPDGTEKRIALPSSLASGYVLSADNISADSLCITLQCTADLVNKGDLTFMPLSNGVPLFFMNTRFPDKEISIKVPKSKLPGGILQLTLLNEKNEPVAERLVFNQYRQQVKMEAGTLKGSYQKREKASLDLQATDASGKPLIGSFSVAVTNADAMMPDEDSETTIFSNLLLSSDLKGYIENPNYYFNQPSAKKNKELDNLLLTQGWRRYTWAQASSNQLPLLKYQPEDKLVVAGSITDSKKTNIGGVSVTLLAGQLMAGALLDTVTDMQGHFIFYLADSLQNLPLRLQAKPKRFAEFAINLDAYLPPTLLIDSLANPQVDGTSINEAAAINYPKVAASHMAAYKNSALFRSATRLKEVKIKNYSVKPKIPNSHSANLNGPGGADVVILPETLETMLDLTTLDVLLPGTKLMVGPAGTVLKLNSTVGTHTPNVLILVDGTEGRSLLDVSPRDVESIEFMKTPAYAGIYGIRGSGGVLLITTKKGGMDNSYITAKASNSLTFKLPLYIKKEFYSPQYNEPAKAAKIQDNRTTVYWKPDVITDKNGKATLSFYNPDVAGNYRVVIEGISAKGNLCRQVFSYVVE